MTCVVRALARDIGDADLATNTHRTVTPVARFSELGKLRFEVAGWLLAVA
jgi:hypothetical protein